MTPYLIIDGYNLMHAAGIARHSYGRGDMGRCRDRMHRELVELLSPRALKQAVIVYDAFASVSDDNRQQLVNGLMVLYAPQGTDADTEIEQLLLQHSVPKRIVVVSSDHRLHKAAGRRRAKCVDSEIFWASLTSNTHPHPHSRSYQSQTMKPNLAPVPADDLIDDLQRWADSAAAELDSEVISVPAQPPQAPSQPESISTAQAARIDNKVDDPVDDLQRWADSTAAAAELEAERDIMGNSIFDEDYLRQLDKEIEEGRLN